MTSNRKEDRTGTAASARAASVPTQWRSWCVLPTGAQGTCNQTQPARLAQQNSSAAQPNGGHVLCGAPEPTLEKEETLAILQGHHSFRQLPWSSMVTDAPGRALCPQILGIYLRCWWQQLQGISQGWIAYPCLSPEGLTLSAAMAPGCQLASEGLLCPQEAGSRHLTRNRALGFAGKTERQLPSAEQRRHPLLQEEQRPRGKPNTLLGPGSPGPLRGWGKESTLCLCQVCRPK